MSGFIASNGVELDEFGDCTMGYETYERAHDARKEFYQHLRDKELGRWRDPEAPNFVVYESTPDNPNRVRVADEITGQAVMCCRDRTGSSDYGDTAARYFAAHPEPKPWHDAKPGEVWEITYRSPRGSEISNRVMTCVDDGGNISFFNEYRLHSVNYTSIESARRIWPEGAK